MKCNGNCHHKSKETNYESNAQNEEQQGNFEEIVDFVANAAEC